MAEMQITDTHKVVVETDPNAFTQVSVRDRQERTYATTLCASGRVAQEMARTAALRLRAGVDPALVWEG
jgi:hypothetical protein